MFFILRPIRVQMHLVLLSQYGKYRKYCLIGIKLIIKFGQEVKLSNCFFITRRMPFDWKTPFGYLVAFIIETTGGYCISYTITCYISFLLASCWMLMFNVNEIRYDLNSINESVKNEDNPSKSIDRFKEFIDFHVKMKQLS